MRIGAMVWATSTMMIAFSGCLVDDEPYHVWATKGSYVAGFAYDGAGITPFNGPAFIDAKDEENTGILVAEGKAGSNTWRIVFEDFAQSKPFHDGGIASNFKEHGDSGVGDQSVPQVDLEKAAWGLATVKQNNILIKDPISGKDQWAAHYMVIRNGVRDDATGGIHNAAHKPYDPMMPADGMNVPGDYELHLQLRNQTANGTPPTQAIGPFMANTPSAMANGRHVFTPTAIGSSATLDLRVTGTGATASNLTFTVMAPGGTEVVRRGVGPGNPPVSQGAAATAQLRFPINELGEYTITAVGRIAPGGGYNIAGVITPPPSIVLNFWWEDLMFGAEAEQEAESGTLLEGTRYHGVHEHASSSMAAAERR